MANNERVQRAQQIWPILIACAAKKQIITYGEIAGIIGLSNARFVGKILGCIMGYCEANNLPPLTSLVVNKQTGLPGEGLYTIDKYPSIKLAQKDVFDYEWNKITPPTMADYEPYKDCCGSNHPIFNSTEKLNL